MTPSSEIAILDFGSQYTHLIARRIRELGVRSHIYHTDVAPADLSNAVGVILSGGPRSLVRDPRLPFNEAIFDLNIPVLGLCYGHQLMADHFGGTVASGSAREYGVAALQEVGDKEQASSNDQFSIFKKIAFPTQVWMSHGDHVEKLPDGFEQIASSGNNSIAAMAHREKKLYGFQFHPEVHHSEHGMQMLHNFVFDICKAEKNWTTSQALEEIQEQIRHEAGDKRVFLLISGGVDSTVCFALLEKTLGKDRVYGLHVDHGMMRHNESKLVAKALEDIGLDDLHVYNAEEGFLQALDGVAEPEAKRKIIGDLFLDITERVMAEQGCNENEWLLGQGTIYPDTIESGGTQHADKIKTHHNRVDRVQEMIRKGLIIEPIKELYKDEVREIGLQLGLPEALIHRHPFPGPGLGIRCLCSDGTHNAPKSLDDQDARLLVLPMQSVGVQGDERSYAHPGLVLDTHALEDFQTLSPALTNRHKEINRVLTCIAGDAEKIEGARMARAFLTQDRLEKLRTLDAIVNKHIADPRCDHVWQFPVVLVPFGHAQMESVVLRPIESREVMTANFAILPEDILEKIRDEIMETGFVDYIFYDVTNKPPGTVEWE